MREDVNYAKTIEFELLVGENRGAREMLERGRYKKKRRTDLRHDWCARGYCRLEEMGNFLMTSISIIYNLANIINCILIMVHI